jgi:DNA polymerase III epsilon subunit family exonuclease
MSVSAGVVGLPGRVCRRSDMAAPAGYAVFDCETTGTTPGRDEIVSVALVRLDADGVETSRLASLVRPSGSIPAEATAVHGISDADVASAPRFAAIAPALLAELEGAVFVAHNVRFDLAVLRDAFERAGIEYRPSAVACTLEAFRLLEPLAPDHRLESLCARHGISLDAAHHALADALATAGLLRLLLARGIAPETVELDLEAFLRLRARGDRRPASDRQIRRVFALAHAAGLESRNDVVALVARVTGRDDLDALDRAQVQDVFDELERLAA